MQGFCGGVAGLQQLDVLNAEYQYYPSVHESCQDALTHLAPLWIGSACLGGMMLNQTLPLPESA